MCTTCVSAANELSQRWMKDDPDRRDALLQVLGLMNGGHYSPQWLALAVDPFITNSYTLADALIWVDFYRRWWSGKLLVAGVCLPPGITASLDRDRDGNNASLAMLPHPFTATFVGGSHGADGCVEWSEPIRLTKTIDIDGEVTTENIEIGPESVPLEVGTINTYNTHCHLGRGYGVARWPYGADRITIIRNTDPWANATLLGADE